MSFKTKKSIRLCTNELRRPCSTWTVVKKILVSSCGFWGFYMLLQADPFLKGCGKTVMQPLSDSDPVWIGGWAPFGNLGGAILYSVLISWRITKHLSRPLPTFLKNTKNTFRAMSPSGWRYVLEMVCHCGKQLLYVTLESRWGKKQHYITSWRLSKGATLPTYFLWLNSLWRLFPTRPKNEEAQIIASYLFFF